MSGSRVRMQERACVVALVLACGCAAIVIPAPSPIPIEQQTTQPNCTSETVLPALDLLFGLGWGVSTGLMASVYYHFDAPGTAYLVPAALSVPAFGHFASVCIGSKRLENCLFQKAQYQTLQLKREKEQQKKMIEQAPAYGKEGPIESPEDTTSPPTTGAPSPVILPQVEPSPAPQ